MEARRQKVASVPKKTAFPSSLDHQMVFPRKHGRSPLDILKNVALALIAAGVLVGPQLFGRQMVESVNNANLRAEIETRRAGLKRSIEGLLAGDGNGSLDGAIDKVEEALESCGQDDLRKDLDCLLAVKLPEGDNDND